MKQTKFVAAFAVHVVSFPSMVYAMAKVAMIAENSPETAWLWGVVATACVVSFFLSSGPLAERFLE